MLRAVIRACILQNLRRIRPLPGLLGYRCNTVAAADDRDCWKQRWLCYLQSTLCKGREFNTPIGPFLRCLHPEQPSRTARCSATDVHAHPVVDCCPNQQTGCAILSLSPSFVVRPAAGSERLSAVLCWKHLFCQLYLVVLAQRKQSLRRSPVL